MRSAAQSAPTHRRRGCFDLGVGSPADHDRAPTYAPSPKGGFDPDWKSCSINLSGSDFSGFSLSKIVLSSADLNGTTNLTNTELTKADLSRASMRFATIRNTDFLNANLTAAHLVGAVAGAAGPR